MQLFKNIDVLLHEIEEASDRISEILCLYELIDEDIEEIKQIYDERQILVTTLMEYYQTENIPNDDKIRITEFLEVIQKKEKINLNDLEFRLKDIGQKIKFISNQKNLKVYSKWS